MNETVTRSEGVAGHQHESRDAETSCVVHRTGPGRGARRRGRRLALVTVTAMMAMLAAGPAFAAAQSAGPFGLATSTESEIEGDPGTDDQFGADIASGDFNGDTFEDMAVGVPFEDVDGVNYAGAVNVIYGNRGGLSATDLPDQLWHQNVEGVEDEAEASDHFGSAVAAGDFDGDGYDDLAVGVGGEGVKDAGFAGAVNVIYGSKKGLDSVSVPSPLWTQDEPGLGDGAEDGDRFGNTLAVGRFDGDAYDDLAIGVQTEDIGDVEYAGAVNLLYGSDTGLSAGGLSKEFVRRFWHQNVSGVAGEASWLAEFSKGLASGDFDGDGYDDLAVGAPQDDLGRGGDELYGAVNVIYGSSRGLAPRGSAGEYWHLDVPGVEGDAVALDEFGKRVAAGDFDGDGYDDLAIGVPFETVGPARIGAVNVIHGSADGLSVTATPDQVWHRNSPDVDGEAGPFARFGLDLAVGRFNGDAYDDLAIGSVLDIMGTGVRGGSVNVIHGSRHGLNATHVPDQLWNQEVGDVEDEAEDRDEFGWALGAGRFNRDGYDDLAIGSPLEDVGTIVDAGAVNVIHGAAGGLSATAVPDQFWNQGS